MKNEEKTATVLDPLVFYGIYDRLVDLNEVLKNRMEKQKRNEVQEVVRLVK